MGWTFNITNNFVLIILSRIDICKLLRVFLSDKFQEVELLGEKAYTFTDVIDIAKWSSEKNYTNYTFRLVDPLNPANSALDSDLFRQKHVLRTFYVVSNKDTRHIYNDPLLNKHKSSEGEKRDTKILKIQKYLV